MADNTVRGRVVWHELMTPDSSASHAFYTRVLGWKTQTWEHDSSYAMFAARSGPVGAAVGYTEGAPHWRHYIATPDIDATVQQATDLGATVVTVPTAIPDGGRYAVLTDPQGATFAIYSSSMPDGPDYSYRPGEFSWLELAASDAKAALKFYGALFGWEKTAEHDMGPLGVYYLFGRNGRDIGGAFDKPAEMPCPPGWLGYVRVKNISKVVSKVKAAGGTLINGPMEVPGGDWIAQFVDPQGAMFAIHALKSDLHPAAAAAEPAPEMAAIEVTAAPVAGRKAAVRNKSTPRTNAKKKTKKATKKTGVSRARPAKKVAGAGRRSAKTLKRSARKAVKVRSRTSKARAAAGRKRPASKATTRKKASARARKGK